MTNSYTEHRWGERPGERTAVVQSNLFFGLLFLWNNLHAVHHCFPGAPWYKLRPIWHAHRDHIIAGNGGFVFKGYGEIARRWLVRPNFIPVHPQDLADIPRDERYAGAWCAALDDRLSESNRYAA